VRGGRGDLQGQQGRFGDVEREVGGDLAAHAVIVASADDDRVSGAAPSVREMPSNGN
jgi:hypothetical protein